MSKVRLIDIYNERFNEPTLKMVATADIEIVPRKMVEMIINECTNIIDVYAGNSNYDCGRSCTAVDIKTLAELLLNEFENYGEV